MSRTAMSGTYPRVRFIDIELSRASGSVELSNTGWSFRDGSGHGLGVCTYAYGHYPESESALLGSGNGRLLFEDKDIENEGLRALCVMGTMLR